MDTSEIILRPYWGKGNRWIFVQLPIPLIEYPLNKLFVAYKKGRPGSWVIQKIDIPILEEQFSKYSVRRQFSLPNPPSRNEIKPNAEPIRIDGKGQSEKPPKREQTSKQKFYGLPEKDQKHFRSFIDFLRSQRLAKNTITVYSVFALDFYFYWLKQHPKAKFDSFLVQNFVADFLIPYNYSVSTHRQAISGIKQFAKFKNIEIEIIQSIFQPKKEQVLPKVLSTEEIIRLIQKTPNIKHRIILALLYSSGLRIGELISLKTHDVFKERRQIIVRMAKGKKDRVVILAESVLLMLDNYLKAYEPKEYFIGGQNGGQYSPNSVRAILKRACKAAGINRKVTPHMLRHSFATHLTEQGVSIRVIQELLGHSKLETTMIYTHVARKDLLNIKSPLDRAVEQALQDKKLQ